MNWVSSAKRLAQMLILLWLAVTVTSTVMLAVTRDSFWRYGAAVGCLAQLIGWCWMGQVARSRGGTR